MCPKSSVHFQTGIHVMTKKGDVIYQASTFWSWGGGEGIVMTSAGEIIPTAKSPQNFSTQ